MKKIFYFVSAGVVLCSLCFYGGMKYGQSSNSFPENFSQNQREQFFQGGLDRELSSSVITGEIISNDDESVTIKTTDNNSMIVFISNSTKISKTIEGTIEDVELGQQVVASGEKNSDGSYTAKTIQISSNITKLFNQ